MINSHFLNWAAQSLSRQKRRPMGLLPDWEIKRLAEEEGMIRPFVNEKIKLIDIRCERNPEIVAQARPALSFGTGHYGYDLRLSSKEFLIFRHVPGTVMDPKQFNPANLEAAVLQHDKNGRYFILPAHSYGLGVALERLCVPSDVTVVCLGKSTYARLGVILNATPAEASWEGYLTLEASNSSGADCRIYVEEGICQLLFFRGEPCLNPYGDGKYQNQGAQIVMARV